MHLGPEHLRKWKGFLWLHQELAFLSQYLFPPLCHSSLKKGGKWVRKEDDQSFRYSVPLPSNAILFCLPLPLPWKAILDLTLVFNVFTLKKKGTRHFRFKQLDREKLE